MKKLTNNITMLLLWSLIRSLIISFFVTALLIVLLCSGKLSAQEKAPIPLSVGDKIPELLWNTPLINVGTSDENQISMANFKGKAIIIDFWTSWCAPCLKNMPALDSIHRSNSKNLKVIMMNASASQTGYIKERSFIKEYLKSHQRFLSPLILRNDLYRQYFYFRVVPHYIWIGPDGEIKAITDHTKFTGANIAKLISGTALDLDLKTK